MKRFLTLMLSFLMLVSVGLPIKAETATNLALGKTVTVSDSEANTFKGDKAVDGIVDRHGAKASRWASNTAPGKKWIQVDLGASHEVTSVELEWERRNASDYSLFYSSNGEDWNLLEKRTELSTSFREAYEFDTIETRYLRLEIDAYNETSEGITWNTVSLYDYEIYGQLSEVAPEPGELINLALNKAATSSDNEGANVGPERAFDGINDRDGERKSRWASNTTTGVKWLQVDLGSKQTLRSFFVEWERRNATNYEILVSNDGIDFTSVFHQESNPSLFRDRIVLDEAVEGQFVRLRINTLDATSEGVTWNNVSVFEFEMYSGTFSLSPEEIVQKIQMPLQTVDDDVLVLPTSDEFTASLKGSHNKYIVDDLGKVGRPLSDKTIQVDLEITIGEETYDLLGRDVLIPGMFDPSMSINPQPIVVPELEEWFGLEGSITIDENSRVMISSNLNEEYKHGVNEFILDFKDLFDIELELVVGNTPEANDFYFYEAGTKGLGKEGYHIELEDGIRVSSNHETGMYWSTRTLLQMMVENDLVLDKGIIRDYPKWDLRGFMLDVGRKTFSMDFLNDLSRQMSWYKMNDFHIHLNDNFIFLEDYTKLGLNPFDAYSGFRLESSVEGLTSEDLFYTNEEFADFMKTSRGRGVDIVPEIDVPAHSLALTQARPDLAYGTVGREADHLDLNNPETLPYVKGIFNDYLLGDNPLFNEETVVHVGTDEYDARFTEEFRQFTDDMLGFIQEDHNRTVRLWGSLTARNGTTPVRSENVQMNIWNSGWANPKSMFDQGFDLINTLDSQLYIVPDAGYYYDYLNIQNLYNNWEANVMAGTTIPASSPQMLGGTFAVWNDQIDLRNNGISEIDVFERIDHAMPTLASKLWGTSGEVNFSDFQENTKAVGQAPRTNLRHEVESVSNEIVNYDFGESATEDFSGNRYDLVSSENVEVNKTLTLKGGKSFIKTPLTDVGLNNTIEFTVKQNTDASEDSEQVLFEHGITQIKASQNKGGKLGFSREGLDYEFNYSLPKNVWTNLAITTSLGKASLHVNGELVDEIVRVRTGDFYASMNASLLIPIEKIGSETDAFEGQISNVRIVDSNEINKLKLSSIIKKAEAVQESNYAETIYANLQSAILDGKELMEKDDLSLAEIDNQVAIIQSLMDRTKDVEWVSDNANVSKEIIDGQQYYKLAATTANNNGDRAGEFIRNQAWNIDNKKGSVSFDFETLMPGNTMTFGLNILHSDMKNYITVGFDAGGWFYEYKIDGAGDWYKGARVPSPLLGTKNTLEVELDNTDLVAYNTSNGVRTKLFEHSFAQDVVNTLDEKSKTNDNVVVRLGNSSGVQSSIFVKAKTQMPAVDFSELEELIASAETINTEAFTAETVKVLQEAITSSKQVLNNLEATQAEVDSQILLLQTAIDALTEEVILDKSNLDMAISLGESKEEADYTVETWNVFIEVFNRIKTDYASYQSQEEIDQAKNLLEDAILALDLKVEVPAVDFSVLETAIEAAEKVNLDGYTKESGAKLTLEIAKSKQLLNNKDARQEEIDEQVETLQAAYAGLVEIKPEEPEVDEVNSKKLEALVASIETLDLKAYTEESSSKLNKALANSKALLSKEHASQEELDASLFELQTALASLEKIELEIPETPVTPDQPKDDLPATGISRSMVLPGLGISTALAGIYLLLKKKNEH